MGKAVIFDLDGTLLNTLDDLADSVNHTLNYFKYSERTKAEVRSFIGGGAKALIKRTPYGKYDKNHDLPVCH